MRILSTNSFDVQQFQKKNDSYKFNVQKKRRSRDFKKIFEEALGEQIDDLEEFRVLLPRNGHFWDDGYEDKE